MVLIGSQYRITVLIQLNPPISRVLNNTWNHLRWTFILYVSPPSLWIIYNKLLCSSNIFWKTETMPLNVVHYLSTIKSCSQQFISNFPTFRILIRTWVLKIVCFLCRFGSVMLAVTCTRCSYIVLLIALRCCSGIPRQFIYVYVFAPYPDPIVGCAVFYCSWRRL